MKCFYQIYLCCSSGPGLTCLSAWGPKLQSSPQAGIRGGRKYMCSGLHCLPSSTMSGFSRTHADRSDMIWQTTGHSPHRLCSSSSFQTPPCHQFSSLPPAQPFPPLALIHIFSWLVYIISSRHTKYVPVSTMLIGREQILGADYVNASLPALYFVLDFSH